MKRLPLDAMTLDLPEGEMNGVAVKRFTVGRGDPENLRMAMTGRATPPGEYTKLMVDGRLWMSDTRAEKLDHLPAVSKIMELEAKRVLINGLGLGMVVKAALCFEHVEHVDVVEIDKRVIDLVGPHYLRDDRVEIHHADAYQQSRRWPPGTRWDVGWSDIWEELCMDNLPSMARLNRSYGRRCTWHGCWSQSDLKYRREQERKQEQDWRDWYE